MTQRKEKVPRLDATLEDNESFDYERTVRLELKKHAFYTLLIFHHFYLSFVGTMQPTLDPVLLE